MGRVGREIDPRPNPDRTPTDTHDTHRRHRRRAEKREHRPDLSVSQVPSDRRGTRQSASRAECAQDSCRYGGRPVHGGGVTCHTEVYQKAERITRMEWVDHGKKNARFAVKP